MRKNKTIKDYAGTKDGAALFTVMGVIFITSMLLATMLTASTQRIFIARKLSDRVKAVAYAEAGVDQAYTILVTNFNSRTNPAMYPRTVFEDGEYDAALTTLSNDVVIIVSTGFCGSVEAVVIVDVKNYGGSGSDTPGFDTNLFQYAMLCGGEMSWSGCGTLSGTGGAIKVHSNGAMDIKGNADVDISMSSSVRIDISNNHDIDGSVTAPILDYNASKVVITGAATEEAVPTVTIPQIDLTPYFNWADDHGEVHEGDLLINSGTIVPDGGILWVNGDVHITGHPTFNGCIIATGDVTISGGDITAPDGLFAIVSRDGSIKNTSSGDIDGMIYAPNGDYTQQANGIVTGQIIVGGDIDKAGNSDIVVFEQSIPTPPDDGSSDPSAVLVGVSAWQQ